MAPRIRQAQNGRDLANAANVINQSIGTSTSTRALGSVMDSGTGIVLILEASPSLLDRLAGSFNPVAGAIVLSEGTPRRYAGALPPNAREHLPENFGDINYLSLAPRMRGLRYAQSLIVPGVEWALGRSLQYAVAASWKVQRQMSSRRVLEGSGFRHIADARMAALNPDRHCPPCEGFCSCSAGVFLRAISPADLAAWAGRRSQPPAEDDSGFDFLV